MRKLVAIFLLVLIPLQSSWAVAAEYCTHHEENAAAQHFGHHADEHANSASDTGIDDGVQSSSDMTPGQPHSDNCHHYSVAGLLNATPQDFCDTPDVPLCWDRHASDPSTSASRIERPNWASLA